MTIDFGAALAAGKIELDLGVSGSIAGRAVTAASDGSVPYTPSVGTCPSGGQPGILDCLLMLLPEMGNLDQLCGESSSSRDYLGGTVVGELDMLRSAVGDVIESLSSLDPLGPLVAAVLGNVMSLLTGALNAISSFGNPFLDCLDSATGGYVANAFEAVRGFASRVGSVMSGDTGELSIGSALIGLLGAGALVLAAIDSAIRTVIGELFNLDALRELLCAALSCISLSRMLMPGSETSPVRLDGLTSPPGSAPGSALESGLRVPEGLGMKEGPECST